jgi:Erv1 / Alr family
LCLYQLIKKKIVKRRRGKKKSKHLLSQEKVANTMAAKEPVTMTITSKNDEKTQEIRLKGWLFQPEIWGGDVWRTFHGFLYKFPPKPTQEDKMRWLTFILNLPYYLPCGECSLNLARELQALPPTEAVMESTDSLARWGVELHNSVNKRLGKPLVTYKDVVEYFYFDAERDPRKVNVEEVPSTFQAVVDSINNPISQSQIVVMIFLLIIGFSLIAWTRQSTSRRK